MRKISKKHPKKSIHHKTYSITHMIKKIKVKKSLHKKPKITQKQVHKKLKTTQKQVHKKSKTIKLKITKLKTIKKAVHKKLFSSKALAPKFCPKCGNLFEGNSTFCKDCNAPDFNFKDVKIMLCNSCRSYFHKNIWHKYPDIDFVIKRIAHENIKSRVVISDISEQENEKIFNYKAGIKKEHIIEVEHHGEYFDIPVLVEVTLCNKCSKKGTKYFEGILQLRNTNDEITAFLKNEVAKQAHKGIYINKETRVDKYSDNNIDFIITDQTYIRILAEKIRSVYGGKIKTNAQHFSINWENSKVLYRLNVLLEIPKYKKNEVVKLDSNLYKIVSLGDKIHVVNLRTNSKTALPHKDSYDVLKPVSVQIIKLFPEAEILDPVTYYQARLINPSKNLKINDEIKVVIDAGEAWMV